MVNFYYHKIEMTTIAGFYQPMKKMTSSKTPMFYKSSKSEIKKTYRKISKKTVPMTAAQEKNLKKKEKTDDEKDKEL